MGPLLLNTFVTAYKKQTLAYMKCKKPHKVHKKYKTRRIICPGSMNTITKTYHPTRPKVNACKIRVTNFTWKYIHRICIFSMQICDPPQGGSEPW